MNFNIGNSVLLLVAVLLLSGCTQSENSSENSAEEEPAAVESIQQSVNETLGVDAYVPEHEDYEPMLATVEYLFTIEDGEEVLTDPRQVTITYQTPTEELFEGIDNEAWEEDNRREILYGDFYQGPVAIRLNILPNSAGNVNEAETIEISGQEVQYQLIEESGGSSAVMAFDVEEVGYLILYSLDDGQTEEDVQAFAQEIIEYY